MRIAIASDLHAEQTKHTLEIPVPTADLWLLAGDIGSGADAVSWAGATIGEGAPIVMIPGNHEFYDQASIAETVTAMKRRAEGMKVSVLDDEQLELEVRGKPIRIVGTTLWTDFDLFGDEQRDRAMQDAYAFLMDYRAIKEAGNLITPVVIRDLHRKSREFLECHLKRTFEGITVVMTHHAPLREAARLDGKDTELTPAFGSDLRAFVETCGADLWVFGHTHQDWDEMVGSTRVVSRQGGYPSSHYRVSERETRRLPPFEPLVIDL